MKPKRNPKPTSRSETSSLVRAFAAVIALPALLACPGGGQGTAPQEPTWQTYRDPAKRFSVEFPGAPQPDTLNGVQRVYLTFTWSIRTYFVTHRELAADDAKADPKQVVAAEADKMITSRKLKGARRQALEVAGRPAMELEAPTSQGVLYARVVLDQTRLYQIFTVTEGADRGEPARFVRSFRPLP